MATIIDEVVDITITRDSVGVTRADFGTILILGDSEPDRSPNVRTYASLAEVLLDFDADSTEVDIATGIFAQAIKVDKILIGQVNTEADPAETFFSAYARISAEYSDKYYGVIITSLDSGDILTVAAAVEAESKIFGVISNDEDIKNNVGNNLLKTLKELGYNRTYLMYTEGIFNWANAAWMGRMFPLDAGSATWAYKDLVGVGDRSELTAAQRANLKEFNGNYFTELAGGKVTFLGVMVSGEYIDVIHGLDWLEAFIQENIVELLKSVPKIPYNNNGIGLVENSLRASLQEGVLRGIINEGFVITTPDVLNISSADKTARLLKDIKFTATLTGAIQNIVINGSVTV
jgi:Protein of unknown function (DUF3383)